MSEVIWGRRPVLEALRAGTPVNRIVLAVENEEVLKAAADRGVSVEHVDRRELNRLSGTDRHQGVAAFVAAFSYRDSKELIETRPARLLLLDGVTDPVNVGSILRSALAFGFNGVLLPRNRSVGITPVVRKVAAGAAELIPIAQTGSPAEVLTRLQSSGVFVVGLDPNGDDVYYSVEYPADALCLVLGAESKGLSRLVKERCDLTVRIPLTDEMASLNVSVAAAIVMAWHNRSRDTPIPLRHRDGPGELW